MLPVPRDPLVLRPEAAPRRRPDRARGPLYVERRATRRALPQPVSGHASGHPWALAIAAPVAVVGAFLFGGIIPAVAAGVVVLLAGQGVVIAGLRHRADRLDRLSKTDELTGLGNSRALWTDLRELMTSSPVGLIMLDLDHFKRVNDEFGHPVGDALLRHAGLTLRIVVGDRGRCYRYGGEELVVVVPGIDEAAGCALADRLRAIIARPPTGLPPVSSSAGVAVGSPGAGAHHLVDRADRALRYAKATGRNRTLAATQSEHWVADHEEPVVAARRAALAMATAALDARDPDTAEHSDDVVLLCEALADRLEISGSDRDHLLTAARLHDVGKVAVPHEILAKPSTLTDDEWAVMREHTITGERILCSVPELAPVAPIVRHAHERYDGAGYPDGLAGEDIPLASRIILCADAFHAIRSDRPYRAARGVDEALQELIANAGGQFDPAITESLVEVVREVHRPTPATVSLKVALRHSPRLLALLMALAIAGTAFAATRPLRHALQAVIPGIGSDAKSAPARPAPGALASCATIGFEGRRCSTPLAVLGPLAIAAPAAGGTHGGSTPFLYEPAHERWITIGDVIPRARPHQVAGTVSTGTLTTTPDFGTGVSGPAAAVPQNFESQGPLAPSGGDQAPQGFAPSGAPAPEEVPIVDETTTVVGDPPAQTPPPSAPPPTTDPTPSDSGTLPSDTGTAPGDTGTAPGTSGSPSGQAGTTGDSAASPTGSAPADPGNSAGAPGQDPAGPGSSENAPSRDPSVGTGGVLAPDETPVAEPAPPTDGLSDVPPPTPAVLPETTDVTQVPTEAVPAGS